ncbi:MAG: hypothetical protein QOJ25_3186 [Solirubrobacteraceae bacterium]|jgi:hypothetical protein|nr:hypothetical protein [Solirubrobacteraceae bacterium]
MGDKDEQITEQENLEGTEETTEATPEVEGHLGSMRPGRPHDIGQKHGPEQKH